MGGNTKSVDVKRAQDEKFQWISSSRTYHRAKSDISINCVKMDKTPYGGISFTFRNDVWQFFGEKVEFAVYKNRIMFRTATGTNGMALFSGSNKSPNKYFKVRVTEDTKILKDKFIGDYELKYDSFYELYYIEGNFEA